MEGGTRGMLALCLMLDARPWLVPFGFAPPTNPRLTSPPLLARSILSCANRAATINLLAINID